MRWLRSGSRHEKAPEGPLEPVRILTPELALDGFVAPTGQRITDILLRGQDLAFLPGGADAAPGNWLMIAPADLLVVIPPPLPPRSEWRSSTEPTDAFAEVGPYRVTGTAHLRPGEKLDLAFRSRQPFLPLTQAAIARAEQAPEEVAVAIVNLDNCSAFGSLDRHPSDTRRE
jgi:hypothetical protein